MPLYITPSNVFVEIPEGQKVPEGWRHLPLGMLDEISAVARTFMRPIDVYELARK